MIKIIRDGTLPVKTNTIYTVTCKQCGCVFECDSSDFDWQTKGLKSKYQNYYFAGVHCPFCKKDITLDGSTPYRLEPQYGETNND